MLKLKRALLMLCLIALNENLKAQVEPTLVADLNQASTEAGSAPAHFFKFKDRLYFSATTPEYGREPWEMDLQGGLGMLTNFRIGNEWSLESSNSYPREFCEAEGKLYFVARNDLKQDVIVVYDGEEELKVVANLGAADLPLYLRYELTYFQGYLYYIVQYGGNNSALWRYDLNGSSESIQTLYPSLSFTNPRTLMIYDNHLLFGADDEEEGEEWWIFSGMDAPKRINGQLPGKKNNRLFPLFDWDGVLYFEGNYGFESPEEYNTLKLWRYDGDTMTVILDTLEGREGYHSEFQLYDGKLHFIVKAMGEQSLWSVTNDGVPEKEAIIDTAPNLVRFPLIQYKGSLYTTLAENFHSPLLRYNKEQKTFDEVQFDNVEYMDIHELVVFQDRLFMSMNNGGYGQELWAMNEEQTVELVADIYPTEGKITSGSYPDQPLVFNEYLYFKASDGFRQVLWRYQGEGEPEKVQDIAPESEQNIYAVTYDNMVVFEDRLLYERVNERSVSELWAQDADGNLEMLHEFEFGSRQLEHMTVFNEHVYFSLQASGEGKELWKYNGSEAPIMVSDLVPGSGSFMPSYLTVFKGKLYFSAMGSSESGIELWSCDATDKLELVADLNEGASFSFPHELMVYNEALYFYASSNEDFANVWKYTGEGEPETVGDVIVHSLFTTHQSAVYRDKLYFYARPKDVEKCVGLYALDSLGNLHAVSDSTTCMGPRNLTVFDDALYFEGYALQDGDILWRYSEDMGFERVWDPRPEPDTASRVKELIVFKEQLYFASDDGSGYGEELWVIDGKQEVSVAMLENASEVHVYPNPSQGQLNITLSEVYDCVQVQVFDLSGKLILDQENLNQHVIPLNLEVASGFYTLSLRVEGKTPVVRKLIIE